MSLKHVMLGFLEMYPLTGYDLKKMFDSSVKYFWTATHSQIYRTLNEMEKEELVEVEFVQQVDLPNKKILHITDKGKHELNSWLLTDLDIPPVRHKLLVQLTWADRLSDEEIINKLELYGEKLKERLKVYKSESHNIIMKDNAHTDREYLLWKLTLQNGIDSYESELKWIAESIKEIKNISRKKKSGKKT